MKSVYARILAWSFLTLLISLAGFLFVTQRFAMQLGAGDVFPRLQALELMDGREAYETGGSAKLAAYIARVDKLTVSKHYILDGQGIDLVNGADRSALLQSLNGRWDQAISIPQGVRVGSQIEGGKYVMIAEAALPFAPWTYLPYYGLILAAVALLCWLLALNIGSPLRSLARMVDKFGQGDLSIRMHSARRDEIGELAGSFDRMADRIETLLTAERRLLQDVSHELRTPLARLGLAAELVRTAPDRDQAVLRLRKEISRLSDLVGTLLQMTRAEGDPTVSDRREFPLDQLMADLVKDCAVEAAARRCEIVFDGDKGVFMAGDAELTRRAVENVLRNAIHYSPEGGAVDVTLRKNGARASISVRDRGPGVPDNQLTRIFEPFFRVDGSRNGATGGVGLGLAIAMRAVKLHQGRIEAMNEKPGLEVKITLPLVK